MAAKRRRPRVRRTPRAAAIVTVKDAPKMTAKGRRAIASWLRRQAGFIEKHGVVLSHRFVARYLSR